MEYSVYFRAFLALIFVAAIILLLGFLLRTRMGLMLLNKLSAREGERAKVISSQNLDEGRRLIVVEYHDIEYLLCVGGNSDILLDKFAVRSNKKRARVFDSD